MTDDTIYIKMTLSTGEVFFTKAVSSKSSSVMISEPINYSVPKGVAIIHEIITKEEYEANV